MNRRRTALLGIGLMAVLVASLVIHTPWCNHLCPMRSIEVLIQRLKGQRVRSPGAVLPLESRGTGDTAGRPIDLPPAERLH